MNTVKTTPLSTIEQSVQHELSHPVGNHSHSPASQRPSPPPPHRLLRASAREAARLEIHVPALNPRLIKHMPLEAATREPDDGLWDVYVNRWWAHEPGKGLLFYGQAPQCNKRESIARSVASRCYPDAEVIFVPRVYIKHRCEC